MRFPDVMGGSVGGLDFSEVFLTKPNIIEMVRTTWDENGCTEVFFFFKYVKLRLCDPLETDNHESRCVEYVEKLAPEKTPRYLIKYRDVIRNPECLGVRDTF